LVFGCSKSDDKENEKLIRLKNCYVDYLFFDDDIRFAYGTPMFSTIGYNRNHCCPAKLQKQGCSKNTV
jgi:hypothetical protein